MMTLTVFSSLKACLLFDLHGDLFFLEPLAVVGEAPASGLRHRTAAHRNNEIGQPRPGVLAVELARPRRMVRMRMVVAHHIETEGARLLVSREHRFRVDQKAVVTAVLPLVSCRSDALDHRRCRVGPADEETAALLRIARRRVPVNALDVAGG